MVVCGGNSRQHRSVTLSRRAAKLIVALCLIAVPVAAASEDAQHAVTYTAHVCLRGLQVTVPNRGWTVYEDQRGEFSLKTPVGLTRQGYIHFWLDPHASAPRGVELPRVGTTAKALIAWLRSNRNLIVSSPTAKRIGRISMMSVKLDLSARAPREDPTCTAPCLTYFVFHGPGYNFPFGTARGEPVRLYLATVRRMGSTRTIAIAVSAPAKSFRAVERVASEILASVMFPAKLTTVG